MLGDLLEPDTNHQREDAIALVTDAIEAGIFNDLGSGSNVDVCIITPQRTDMLRNFKKPNERVQKEKQYLFRHGTTAWTAEKIRSLIISEEVRPVAAPVSGEAMDTSGVGGEFMVMTIYDVVMPIGDISFLVVISRAIVLLD